MPNWSKGVLKIRGKKKNLLMFLHDGIERYGCPFLPKTDEYTLYPLDIQTDECGDIFVSETDDKNHSWLYIKNTRRCFIEKNIEWHWSGDNSEADLEREYIQCLDIKQAWCIEAENFKNLSKKYKVDFRITAYECGMEFSQQIEVIKGEITINKEQKYDNYQWEAYDPRLGG